jgi:hypothetical protein
VGALSCARLLFLFTKIQQQQQKKNRPLSPRNRWCRTRAGMLDEGLQFSYEVRQALDNDDDDDDDDDDANDAATPDAEPTSEARANSTPTTTTADDDDDETAAVDDNTDSNVSTPHDSPSNRRSLAAVARFGSSSFSSFLLCCAFFRLGLALICVWRSRLALLKLISSTFPFFLPTFILLLDVERVSFCAGVAATVTSRSRRNLVNTFPIQHTAQTSSLSHAHTINFFVVLDHQLKQSAKQRIGKAGKSAVDAIKKKGLFVCLFVVVFVCVCVCVRNIINNYYDRCEKETIDVASK